MYFQCSGYHESNMSPRRLREQVHRVVRNLKKLQEQKKLKFDAIAFRGVSGSAVAYPVSVLGGFHLINIRKRRRHHGARVEGSGTRNIRRYIILDDFIGTGKTIREIVRAVKQEKGFYDEPPECVGIVVYDKDERNEKNRSARIYRKQRVPVFKV